MEADSELLLLLTINTIEKARKSFWEFCKLIQGDFYKDDRWHLKKLCETLQDFHEGELGRNLMVQMPPRHGKSRTLTMFTAWVLGLDPTTKTLTASYSDELAYDFSKWTRNIIAEEKVDFDCVYSDVFPKTKIKRGDSALHQWAVEGQHFSYKGTGIGGGITGKGGNYLIIDDSIKGAEEAFNDNYLRKVWTWYTGTWLSRQESGAKKIICETPWSKNDLTGRLRELEPDDWHVLQFEAWNKEQGMLCDDILGYEEYNNIKSVANKLVFMANYHNIRLDQKGAVYKEFKTYRELPKNSEIVAYTDTADKGNDYLCSIIGHKFNSYIYVVDVYFTQDSQEITEPETAKRHVHHKCESSTIESNSGGRAFKRNVERILAETYKWHGTDFIEKDQTKNKEARILSNSTNVQNAILFPEGWEYIWPEFYKHVMDYNRIKNDHDDGPDTITGLYEEYIFADSGSMVVLPNVI